MRGARARAAGGGRRRDTGWIRSDGEGGQWRVERSGRSRPGEAEKGRRGGRRSRDGTREEDGVASRTGSGERRDRGEFRCCGRDGAYTEDFSEGEERNGDGRRRRGGVRLGGAGGEGIVGLWEEAVSFSRGRAGTERRRSVRGGGGADWVADGREGPVDRSDGGQVPDG